MEFACVTCVHEPGSVGRLDECSRRIQKAGHALRWTSWLLTSSSSLIVENAEAFHLEAVGGRRWPLGLAQEKSRPVAL